MKRQADIIFLLCVCLLVGFIVREQATGLHSAWEKLIRRKESRKKILVPEHSTSATLIELLSTGMKPMIADFYWVKATTVKADAAFAAQRKVATGEMPRMLLNASIQRTPRDDYELYELLRCVTLFDPHFEYAYFYGSHLLAFNNQRFLALSLLQDGLEKNPNSGTLASTMSFIYYYLIGDLKKGAYWARISYLNGGKYSLNANAVANLYAAGKDYDVAIDFYTKVYNSTKDPETRDEIEKQVRYLYVEKDIEFLQRAVNKYKKINEALPPNLERMVKLKVIGELPEEPFGGKYIIGTDGKVTNDPPNRFEHFQRMREHIPKRGTQPE